MKTKHEQDGNFVGRAPNVHLERSLRIRTKVTVNVAKQDHQALLKAKYCPRVAAASRTQKNTQKSV